MAHSCRPTAHGADRALGHRSFVSSTVKVVGWDRLRIGSFAVVCVSEFLTKRIFESTGHKNLVTIPNIIDTDIFTYMAKPPSEGGPVSMMCIASWKLPKRLDLILESLCTYASESAIDIELTVAGDGMHSGPSAKVLRTVPVAWR